MFLRGPDALHDSALPAELLPPDHLPVTESWTRAGRMGIGEWRRFSKTDCVRRSRNHSAPGESGEDVATIRLHDDTNRGRRFAVVYPATQRIQLCRTAHTHARLY